MAFEGDLMKNSKALLMIFIVVLAVFAANFFLSGDLVGQAARQTAGVERDISVWPNENNFVDFSTGRYNTNSNANVIKGKWDLKVRTQSIENSVQIYLTAAPNVQIAVMPYQPSGSKPFGAITKDDCKALAYSTSQTVVYDRSSIQTGVLNIYSMYLPTTACYKRGTGTSAEYGKVLGTSSGVRYLVFR